MSCYWFNYLYPCSPISYPARSRPFPRWMLSCCYAYVPRHVQIFVLSRAVVQLFVLPCSYMFLPVLTGPASWLAMFWPGAGPAVSWHCLGVPFLVLFFYQGLQRVPCLHGRGGWILLLHFTLCLTHALSYALHPGASLHPSPASLAMPCPRQGRPISYSSTCSCSTCLCTCLCAFPCILPMSCPACPGPAHAQARMPPGCRQNRLSQLPGRPSWSR